MIRTEGLFLAVLKISKKFQKRCGGAQRTYI